ncbi:MAG: anti-sigma factor [Rhodoplanes sp.]
MTADEDRAGLAAEYVLGTLDAAEREQAEQQIRSDTAFAALVQDWERRLGELHAMVDPVPPPPELWMAIQGRLAEIEPAAAEMRLPEFLASSAPRAEAEPTNVVDLTRRLQRWRGGAIGLGALAAALAGVVVTAAIAPERLPQPLRPKPKVETVEVTRDVVRTVEVPSPSRFVAVLQSGPTAPAFIMTVDLAQRNLTVRRVAAEEQAGKSYELWLVSDKYPAPRSLGVIGAGEFTQVPALSAYDRNTISTATFAVSLEPEGGSPTGTATGPVLFSGKLLEAAPPTRSP